MAGLNCYNMWLLAVVATCVSLKIAGGTAFQCKSPLDCSLAGACMSPTACKCDPGWVGPRCESLNLRGKAQRTFTNLPASVNGTTIGTVWGGHTLNSSDGMFWFGSVITNNKTLADWDSSSAGGLGISQRGVVFELDEVVLNISSDPGAWDGGSIHGVYPIVNPAPWPNRSDAYLLFFTGFTGGKEAMASRKIAVAYAPHPRGPWNKWGVVLGPNTNSSAKDSSSVSNAAPAFVNDGSGRILLAYKGLGKADAAHSLCTDGSGKPCIFVAQADHWTGPYTRPSADAGVVIVGEDPSLWQDTRGSWHLIFEHYNYSDPTTVRCGAHGYSESGVSDWNFTPVSTWYSTSITLDGEPTKLRKRERPQIVLSGLEYSKRPIALFNGACVGIECFNIFDHID